MPIEEIIQANRRRLARREIEVLARISGLFDDAIEETVRRAERAADLVLRRIAAGESPVSAMISEERADAILARLEEEMVRISVSSANLVRREQRAVTIQAARDFLGLMDEMGVQAAIDEIAIARIGGSLLPGAPVANLFAALPEIAVEQARRALFVGVALGDNPRKIGAAVRRGTGITKSRALTIARTETLRAYRGSMRERMRDPAVRGSIEGWVWTSARDRRTCAVCWAMHGQVFPLEQAMGTHPNCRCSQAPLARRTQVPIGDGPREFERLPARSQREILGGAKYRAYRDGAIDLPDLVAVRSDPTWGTVRFERSLVSILGDAARPFYVV